MSDFFFRFDHYLFFLINRTFANPVFDSVMPLLRDKLFWLPLYAFIFSFLAINFKKKGLVIIVLLVLTVAISDQMTSSILKPLIHRLRPCNDPNLITYVRTIVGCKPGLSFPSAHAANHFAVAVFLGLIFLRKTNRVLIAGIVWALSVSFAQIYIGVHYPTDIVAGALTGIFCAFLIYYFYLRLFRFFSIEK